MFPVAWPFRKAKLTKKESLLKLGKYFRTLLFLLIKKNIFKCTNFAIIKY